MMQASLTADVQQVLPIAFENNVFGSLCTIRQPDGNFGAGGAPSGNYTNVAGMINVPAMDAPPSMARLQATEVKALAEIMQKGLRHLLMKGSFPALVAAVGEGTLGKGGVSQGWQAVVTQNATGNAIIYDILGAEIDSQNVMTRLELQLVGV